MLSIGAFNALLKTLEEPPGHVKFILATTEVHKLPVTIVSRCQRFDFKRVSPEAMKGRMELIAQKEGFTCDEEALSLIARIADGGMRDALSLLDQCTGHGKSITADIVCRVAGMTGKDHLFALADAAGQQNPAKALEILNELHSASCDMERLCSDMINHLRNLMIVKTVRSSGDILVCTDSELEQYKTQSAAMTLEEILYGISLLQESLANIKRGVNRRIEMEMAMIKLASPSLSSDNQALLRRISDLEHKLRAGVAPAAESEPQQTKPQSSEEPEAKPSHSEKKPSEEASAQDSLQQDEAIEWAEVLMELTSLNMPLWGVLQNSSAVIRGDRVLIISDNPTLSQFIRTGTNARDVKEAVWRVTGKKFRLGLANSSAAPQQEQKPKRDPLENLISSAQDMGINIQVDN